MIFADLNSSDENAAVDCLNYNLGVFNECIIGCNGKTCEFECGQTLFEEMKKCPCYEDCPSGCSGCSSAFCKCSDPTTDPEYVECQERVIVLFFSDSFLYSAWPV